MALLVGANTVTFTSEPLRLITFESSTNFPNSVVPIIFSASLRSYKRDEIALVLSKSG